MRARPSRRRAELEQTAAHESNESDGHDTYDMTMTRLMDKTHDHVVSCVIRVSSSCHVEFLPLLAVHCSNATSTSWKASSVPVVQVDSADLEAKRAEEARPE